MSAFNPLTLVGEISDSIIAKYDLANQPEVVVSFFIGREHISLALQQGITCSELSDYAADEILTKEDCDLAEPFLSELITLLCER